MKTRVVVVLGVLVAIAALGMAFQLVQLAHVQDVRERDAVPTSAPVGDEQPS